MLQENVGAFTCCCAGAFRTCGFTVGSVADGEPHPPLSKPQSPEVVAPPPIEFFPKTNLSNSASPPGLDARPLAPGRPPKDRKSVAEAVLIAPEADACSSSSFRVCSCSIRAERDFIVDMKAWNCSSPSKGPRLMPQRIGRISVATTSRSQSLPISLNTSNAAI